MQQSCTFLPVMEAQDEVELVCVTLFDYTDIALYQRQLACAIAELRDEKEEQARLISRLDEAQSQLLQSEKMASIGQLAAEVAHDLGDLIKESKDGLERVKRIVQDLKDFSRVDSGVDWQWADLHKCLDSTLNVVANEIKYKASVIKNYGQLPEVECIRSSIRYS